MLAGQIVAVLVVGGLIFIDSSTLERWFSEPTRFIQQDPECDLHVSTCTITISPTIKFELGITPRTIPLMEPLTFSLNYQGIDIQSLKGKIYATNMDMGVHRITLSLKEDGLLEGKVVLPTCLVGNMKWRAEFPLPKQNPDDIKDTIVFTFQTDI